MPGVYALGDVKGGPAFTHISYDDFRIIRTNLLEGGEIMSVIQVAMMGSVPYTVLREGTFAHPTLAESLNNLFSSFVE